VNDYVVFDFEAVTDPDCPPAPVADPERLPATIPATPHFTIVSGAILPIVWQKGRFSALSPRLLGTRGGGDEEAILRDFVSIVDRKRPTLVSWNGRGFDLPLVIARCLRHGVVAPWLWERDFEDRYRGEHHLDLQDAVSLRGAGRPSRMAAFAKLCGFPGKLDVKGSDVEGLWAAGEEGRVKVRRYNLEDVVTEAAILMRVLLCQGKLPLAAYQGAAASLLERVDTDAKLSGLRGEIDRDRFLLRGAAEGPEESGERSPSVAPGEVAAAPS
jgi:hypothetical protein